MTLTYGLQFTVQKETETRSPWSGDFIDDVSTQGEVRACADRMTPVLELQTEPYDELQSIIKLNHWSARPVPIIASTHDDNERPGLLHQCLQLVSITSEISVTVSPLSLFENEGKTSLARYTLFMADIYRKMQLQLCVRLDDASTSTQAYKRARNSTCWMESVYG